MKRESYKGRVLEALKSCDSHLSAQELATLLEENGEAPWDPNRVHTKIYDLKKAGYRITTKKKGRVAFFKLQPPSTPSSRWSPGHPPVRTETLVGVSVPPPISSKPFNGVSAPPKEPKPINMAERCAHLIQAGRSLSAYQVADFFEVSLQEAQTLLFQTANGNPGKYKLTIRIEAV